MSYQPVSHHGHGTLPRMSHASWWVGAGVLLFMAAVVAGLFSGGALHQAIASGGGGLLVLCLAVAAVVKVRSRVRR
jgi:hypothetical protein